MRKTLSALDLIMELDSPVEFNHVIRDPLLTTNNFLDLKRVDKPDLLRILKSLKNDVEKEMSR